MLRAGYGIAMLADEIAEGRFEDNKSKCLTWKTTDGSPALISPAGIAKDAIIIRADNVCMAYESETLDASDLPCIAPPFPRIVIESSTSPAQSLLQRWGLVINSQELDSLAWEELRHIFVDQNIEVTPRWFLFGWFFIHVRGERLPRLQCITESLADGRGVPLFRGICDWFGEQEKAAAWPWMSWFINLAHLTVSFMHCKNVVQRVVAPPPKLSKRHKERHGRPLFSYRVLEIEPMKQVLRTEGRSEEVGLAKALHICRGHFKDYRERGLFGRNKGLYWWDQHARGSIEAGVVGKDYSVKAPT